MKEKGYYGSAMFAIYTVFPGGRVAPVPAVQDQYPRRRTATQAGFQAEDQEMGSVIRILP